MQGVISISLSKFLNKTNNLLTFKQTSPKRRHVVQSHKAYVGLGSNMGDRAANLLLGVRGMLDAGLIVTKLSAIYETEPVDVQDQPYFLNMVAELRINTPRPEQMMARLMRIEYALGRRRDAEQNKGPRIIDLDLLLYGHEERDNQLLILPHARMHQRRFVLTPLAELEPQLVHPTLKKTVFELLQNLDDKSKVERWHPEYIPSY
jgi:2-amino-4-hydroxy-6-hydroxymethyldihydropteridine diphosphokinase